VAFTTKKETPVIKRALEKTPRRSAARRTFCSTFSPERTKKVPRTEATTPTAAIVIGIVILATLNPYFAKAAAPSAIVATMEPT